MRNLLICRRTFIAALSIACLTLIGLARGIDVSVAISGVAIGLAAANSHERAAQAKAEASASKASPLG